MPRRPRVLPIGRRGRRPSVCPFARDYDTCYVRRATSVTCTVLRATCHVLTCSRATCLRAHVLTCTCLRAHVRTGTSARRHVARRTSHVARRTSHVARRTSHLMTSYNLVLTFSAGVVKLADARDSKSRSLRGVRVRPPPPAPTIQRGRTGISFSRGAPIQSSQR